MSDVASHPISDLNSSVSSTVETALQAAQQGASDAKVAAERFLASSGKFVTRFVYTTCYTVSYGVVFPSMIVARSVPRQNAAVRGLVDGAAAATRRADEVLGHPAIPSV